MSSNQQESAWQSYQGWLWSRGLQAPSQIPFASRSSPMPFAFIRSSQGSEIPHLLLLLSSDHDPSTGEPHPPFFSPKGRESLLKLLSALRLHPSQDVHVVALGTPTVGAWQEFSSGPGRLQSRGLVFGPHAWQRLQAAGRPGENVQGRQEWSKICNQVQDFTGSQGQFWQFLPILHPDQLCLAPPAVKAQAWKALQAFLA